MTVKARLKEITIDDMELRLAFNIYCDTYDHHVHSPKVSLIFTTKNDKRRIPLLISFYEPTEHGCRIYASYRYFLDNIFWNTVWNECEVGIVVEYGTERFTNVPISVDCTIPKRTAFQIQVSDQSIQIVFQEKINCLRPKNPGFLQVILSLLCHTVNGLVGILLLPWFMIDSLAIMLLGTEEKNDTIEGPFLKQFIMYVGWRYFGFCRNTKGITGAKLSVFKASYYFQNCLHRKKKKLLFFSNRRPDLTGNLEFVYREIKDKGNCLFWLEPEDTKDLSVWSLVKLGKYMAEAKVILTDDYTPLLNELDLNPKTKLVQLWHACGAFKTFGFSRLGKPGGPKQSSIAHRYYDDVIVSSSMVAPYYAEGFGVSVDKVFPLGIPRTDVFFDQDYAAKTKDRLYQEYPMLAGKKVILFAPTFRGNGKLSAYYDKDKFDPNRVIEEMPEDEVLIIKHHPFVHIQYDIKAENQDRILDLSEESEINDLLFVTDVLITDYSSVIFEASLLNIPMLFYAYDLREYITSRDIYSEYDLYVPGKVVETQEQLIDALRDVKPDQEKMNKFRNENFEFLDGNSSRRVAEKVMSLMDE